MHAKTWFPSNEMHESPNLTNEPLWGDGDRPALNFKVHYIRVAQNIDSLDPHKREP